VAARQAEAGRGMTAAEQQRTWTPADIFALGVRTDVPTAGAIIAGWGPSESYKAVARGDFPVPVIRVGRRMVVPVAPIADLLGLKDASTHETTVPRSTRAADRRDLNAGAGQDGRAAGSMLPDYSSPLSGGDRLLANPKEACAIGMVRHDNCTESAKKAATG
jgi:hypothetical protein